MKAQLLTRERLSQGENSFAEVERDVKAVHSDVTALLHCGLLDKTGNGKVLFPYDAVHMDFILRAAVNNS